MLGFVPLPRLRNIRYAVSLHPNERRVQIGKNLAGNLPARILAAPDFTSVTVLGARPESSVTRNHPPTFAAANWAHEKVFHYGVSIDGQGGFPTWYSAAKTSAVK
jgi:hypothetical protein